MSEPEFYQVQARQTYNEITTEVSIKLVKLWAVASCDSIIGLVATVAEQIVDEAYFH